MEKEKLLARWHVLLNEPDNATGIQDVLEERRIILHRLNELGVKDVEGVSIVRAMEETNVLVWKTAKASAS